MNNPSLDDSQVTNADLVSSRDYYPDRYMGGLDHGGVHFNSGIANLFFYLLSQGGTHPKNKTDVVVPAIGIEQARRIWYYALKNEMGPNTNFAGARQATADAAAELFRCKSLKQPVVDAVHKAWDAVGVPDNGQSLQNVLGLTVSSSVLPCLLGPKYNLLLNSGFERGAQIRREEGAVITQAAGQPAHGPKGSWKAWLGTASSQSLYQQVTVPSVATSATLSFWLRVDTAPAKLITVEDTLKVQLRDQANNVLTTLATYSNVNKAGYTMKTFDVTAYKGQTVRVHFQATANGQNPTAFVLDDVALEVE